DPVVPTPVPAAAIGHDHTVVTFGGPTQTGPRGRTTPSARDDNSVASGSRASVSFLIVHRHRPYRHYRHQRYKPPRLPATEATSASPSAAPTPCDADK